MKKSISISAIVLCINFHNTFAQSDSVITIPFTVSV